MRDLLSIPSSALKVLSAAGIGNVPPGVEAVVRILVPVVTRDSPYASKIVALIDLPPAPNPPAVGELQRVLGDRLFILDQPSIEEYIPEEIYMRIGRDKSDDIQQIAKLKSKYHELITFKKELSQQIAAQLTGDDLARLGIVVSAVRKAIGHGVG